MAIPRQARLYHRTNPATMLPTASRTPDNVFFVGLMMSDLPAYELLGKFYLGRTYDLETRQLKDEDLLYDSKDLVTHAMCVGMTGSGKTGLCLSLLEEAAIDEIPAICIDPKGDLGNLLLTFPALEANDFKPWLDADEAARKGVTLDELAVQTAATWKQGLAKWDQDGTRVQRFKDRVDINLYTPGSKIGLPLTVLKSFDAPPEATLEDGETFRERVASAASGLLTLLGINADPLSSREHILLSTIFDRAWRQKQDIDLAELIRQIQSPPVDRIGVVDLESFMPSAERMKLAMSLNNLLASPAFAGWLEGESLNIRNLLYTQDGKPKLSIISIAHLNDAERMFFVTLFLGELLSWVRAQPGTSSLRAIFYMDEVYGYFPPTAKPPSKPPMLTLLKQARAFGLGIMLATQNPVDLDYKSLANMGTWFLGRLQAQRDKDRVLDGLEGVAAQSGKGFDRGSMDRLLSSLSSRVFLMSNVHQDRPEIFQSRWALSFLRGPLSREQIQALMREKREVGRTTRKFSPLANPVDPASSVGTRPIVPANVVEKFALHHRPRPGSKLVYRPYLLGQASLHYVRATSDIDYWADTSLVVPLREPIAEPFWENATTIPDGVLELASTPDSGFSFAGLSPAFTSTKNLAAWEKELKDHLYRQRSISIFTSKALKQRSRPEQSEADARIELSQAAREARDRAVGELKAKTAEKVRALEARIAAAELKVAKEKSIEKSRWVTTIVDAASSVFGAILGNKIASKTNMTRAAAAAKKFGQANDARGSVARAEDALREIVDAKLQLELDCIDGVERISEQFRPENLVLESIEIPPRKTDTRIRQLALIWIPWQIDSEGSAEPLIDLPG